MSEFNSSIQARELLKKYRDLMVKEHNSSWLSPVICKLNEEIKKQEDLIEKAIKEGKGKIADLFITLDYGAK